MKTTNQVLILLFLGCALQSARAYAYSYNIDPFTKPSPNSRFYQSYSIESECTKAGLMCKSCTDLVNCIQIETGKFLEVLVKSCDEEKKEFCLMNKCSTAPNPQCAEEGASEFDCHNTGVFPDPVDCRVYHMCVEERHRLETETETEPTPTMTTPGIPPTNKVKPEAAPEQISSVTVAQDLLKENSEPSPTHISVKCDDGYGYNPVSTYCDKKLSNGICLNTPIPACKELGQMGAVPSTSIFYVCMEDKNENIVPNLYMCPAGTKFVNGTCSSTK